MLSDKAKTPSQSAVETRYLLMPHQANPYGTAFGGVIMAWIDMIAAMAAQRHSCTEVVTASIDSISFKEPIRVGDQVVLKACVNYTGRTSMEVGVQVTREDYLNGNENAVVTTTAHLTFVALDENKKPTAVATLVPETLLEKKRYHNAMLRVQTRKDLLKKMGK